MDIHKIIKIDPEIMGGTPCFSGTRVPVRTLTDHLVGGETIEDVLDGFPSVTREQLVAFLETAEEIMIHQVVHGEAVAR